MKLISYPEYKKSELPWLNEVPAHWDILPNRAIFNERITKNQPNEKLLSVTIKRGVIQQTDLLKNSSKKDSSNEDKSNYKLVLKEDLPYNKMRMWQGAVGVSQYRGIVSPAYIILTPRKIADPWYFHYLLRTPAYIRESYRYSYGICDDQLSLRFKDFKVITSPVPPKDEQNKIVTFIRAAENKINNFIQNKRRLIALLKEQKQAIINHAVTRGIDPNVRLKPSGVEWLGNIPGHWEVMPIKRVFSSMIYGTSESSGDEGQYQVLTMGNINDGKVSVSNCGRLKKIVPDLLLEKNDLLFNRTNSRELVGKVGIFKETKEDNVTFASYLVRMRVNERVFPRYINYLLNSPNVLAFARQHSIPSLHQSNLNPTRYGRLQVPIPSKDEQEELLNYIDKNISIIEYAIERAEREIDLIRSYRTRLISDVVTGKIDVRNVEVEDVPDVEEVIDAEPDEESEELTEEEVMEDVEN
ncbi:restriction endonuclease subunit S [Thermodesulfobacteriota bacterium]